jgi:NADP-dependent 3-hydroxy acid dehydrogenase YdfG
MKGKTVLVTGASSGIGKACAQQFAKLGCKVILTARRLDRLKEIAQDLPSPCTPIELDVQDNAQVEEVFKNLEVDILINNAGLPLGLDKLQDGNVGNWDQVIDTNIKGLLYVTRAALPSMIKKNSGHIINIGSVSAHWVYQGGSVYCATKHAVKAISQGLRLDLKGTAIRVSEIDPGAVETEFSQVRFNDGEKAKKIYQGFEPLVADDIADAVVYCATRPPHVNVAEIMIYPQAQAAITEFHRA